MANTLKHKQSSVAGKVPLTTDLALGELAINTRDGKLYLKKNVSGVETIVDVTAGGLLPASSSTLGGVKGLTNLTIDASGNLSLSGANVGSALGYTPANKAGETFTGAVQVNAAGVPTIINSTSGNTYKTAFQDNGTVRSYIGAGANKCFSVTDQSVNEMMFIDQSGRMIKPNHPCFSVTGPYVGGYWTISSSAGSGYNVALTGIHVNNGGHYNSSNGRFTAPVAGRYHFSLTYAAAGAYSGPQAYFTKNGSAQSGNIIGYTSTGYCNAAGSIILSLAAGDYVAMYWQANNMDTAIDMSRTIFSGFLIG